MQAEFLGTLLFQLVGAAAGDAVLITERSRLQCNTVAAQPLLWSRFVHWF
jgi:hypothetical protein